MSDGVLIALIGLGGTILIFLLGLLNYRNSLKQTHQLQKQLDNASTQVTNALSQLEFARKQLELAEKQPGMQLLQRSVAEVTGHLPILIEKPYLRRYFYDNESYTLGDKHDDIIVHEDAIKSLAELMLTNYASAIIHASMFLEYPYGGIVEGIRFHLRQSPAIRDYLFDHFDKFPVTGLKLVYLNAVDKTSAMNDLVDLIKRVPDGTEKDRRIRLLKVLGDSPIDDAVVFARIGTMDTGRALTKSP